VNQQRTAERKAEQMAEQTTEPNTSDEEKRRLLMGAGDAAIEGKRLQAQAEKLAEELAQLDHVAAKKAVLAVRKVHQKAKQEQKVAEQARAAEANSAGAAVAQVAQMKQALQDLVQHGLPQAPSVQQQVLSERYRVDSAPPTQLPGSFSSMLASRLEPNAQTSTRLIAEWGLEVGSVTGLSRTAGEPGCTYLATATQVFKVEGGKVVHVAGGSTRAGFADGTANNATFHDIVGISAARTGAGDVLYVADKGNHAIRRVAGGLVSTVAGGKAVRCVECDDARAALDTCCKGQGIGFGMSDGTGAEALFRDPVDVALLVSGTREDVYVVDQSNHMLRHVYSTSGEYSVVQTVAGTTAGFQDGLPWESKLRAPGAVAAVAIDDTTHRLFVADTGNRAVRMMDIGMESYSELAARIVQRVQVAQNSGMNPAKTAAARQLLRTSWTNKLANAKKFRVNLPVLHEEITTETQRLHGLKTSLEQVRAHQGSNLLFPLCILVTEL
jgi:hypothetical protein